MGCTLVQPQMHRNLKRMFQEISLCRNDYKTVASGDYRKVFAMKTILIAAYVPLFERNIQADVHILRIKNLMTFVLA